MDYGNRLGGLVSTFLCRDSDVIPIKHQRPSGILSHAFRVKVGRIRGSVLNLRELPVDLLLAGQWEKYLVPVAKFPSEVEALVILSEVDGESEREGRYIRVHSAYEAVVRPRDVALSSIRHALAHPITALTRPDVCAALNANFGGMRIDLRTHKHQKILYHSIARMLVATEIAIFSRISSEMHYLIPRQ